jgi:hypothetical protein
MCKNFLTYCVLATFAATTVGTNYSQANPDGVAQPSGIVSRLKKIAKPAIVLAAASAVQGAKALVYCDDILTGKWGYEFSADLCYKGTVYNSYEDFARAQYSSSNWPAWKIGVVVASGVVGLCVAAAGGVHARRRYWGATPQTEPTVEAQLSAATQGVCETPAHNPQVADQAVKEIRIDIRDGNNSEEAAAPSATTSAQIAK